MEIQETALIYPNGQIRRVTDAMPDETFTAVEVPVTDEERATGCVGRFILAPPPLLQSGESASFVVTVSVS